jgi:hypothetical protein
MGKFVGLVGAMTTVGAMAYLMAPLPQSATSTSDLTNSTVARYAVPASKVAAAPKPVTTPSPGQPAPTLVQQIQTELHRLGCYNGAIDGQWSPATQRAMQTLGERVSVLRPVDTPDFIMLALARDQSGTVCSPSQRTTTAGLSDRPAPSATPEVTSKGAVRPTNGTTRVALPEPERPSGSPSPKAWRAVPDAPPKRVTARAPDPSVDAARLKAAREELDRRPAAAVAANPPAPEPSTEDPAPSVAQLPEANRMGLGVGPGDPLNAYTDPRNPNAPAILRAPPQSQPRVALQAGEQPALHAPAPAPVAQAAPPPAAVAPSALPPARVARREATRDWRRNVFNDMRFNGP